MPSFHNLKRQSKTMLKSQNTDRNQLGKASEKVAKLSYSRICKRCDKTMIATVVSADSYTFECATCGRIETETSLLLLQSG